MIPLFNGSSQIPLGPFGTGLFIVHPTPPCISIGLRADLEIRCCSTPRVDLQRQSIGLEMLQAANQSIAVTGDKVLNSVSMDATLKRSIANAGLRPSQAFLPTDANARFNLFRLPLVPLGD
ncbi:unnamed protein product [Penicillium roqueforti FM164]|uniref:Genomic scaffold, ProqFM164S01 n=1 Tax=Penicillium roqueforti (strain FM164) TaxID=1365484 RepID=W6PWE8_PENRF|nr:unnamed protein product [Penicillium roqueforti FM164]